MHTRGRTGTGWQRNSANVRAEADEETSHCGDAPAGTCLEREVVHGRRPVRLHHQVSIAHRLRRYCRRLSTHRLQRRSSQVAVGEHRHLHRSSNKHATR